MGELLSLKGYVSGTGDYTLDSDLLYSTVTYVRMPKGLKAKIWCKRISGEAAEVKIQYTNDVTVATPTWKDLSVEKLASAGELVLEKRRPLVIHSITGKEAFKITRSSGTGDSYVEVEVEFE